MKCRPKNCNNKTTIDKKFESLVTVLRGDKQRRRAPANQLAGVN